MIAVEDDGFQGGPPPGGPAVARRGPSFLPRQERLCLQRRRPDVSVSARCNLLRRRNGDGTECGTLLGAKKDAPRVRALLPADRRCPPISLSAQRRAESLHRVAQKCARLSQRRTRDPRRSALESRAPNVSAVQEHDDLYVPDRSPARGPPSSLTMVGPQAQSHLVQTRVWSQGGPC